MPFNFNIVNILPIIYAILGGVLPALIWLFFWLREDKKDPEPKIMIFLAFLGGVIAVCLSLFFEKIVFNIDINKIFYSDFLKNILDWFNNIAITQGISVNKLLLVSIFAPFIEELCKFVVAFILVLRSKQDDEPIDPMIYMVTVALGFAAIENTLFLIDPILKNDLTVGILTGNIRFIGATLLHTVSSVTVAIFIAFNFYDSKLKKFIWTITGLICAIIIHAGFNYLMIGSSRNSFFALEGIWILVIIVMLVFEKIKMSKIKQ